MQVGHLEPRRWTSADGSRSASIEAYIPVDISEQQVVSAMPEKEASVERAIQALKGHLAVRPLSGVLLRSEGIASSRIEGEVASTRRVFEAEYATSDVRDEQAQRILNSIHVMSEVVASAEGGMSHHDFDQWHARLFDGVTVVFDPGVVRTNQNWIGARTDTPVGADFVPPPPEHIGESLRDLASFVNRLDVAPLTQAAVAHAHFETIHPYPDGNGRIGRALVYRSWAYRGVTTTVYPPISRILVENRELYIEGLTSYRSGDVDRWLDFFFDVVQSAISYTHSLATRLENLDELWHTRLAGAHNDALSRRLVDDLSARPVLSVSEVANHYGVTERGARSALDDLVERGILEFRSLRKAKRGRPAKVYEATELFTLLDLNPQEVA